MLSDIIANTILVSSCMGSEEAIGAAGSKLGYAVGVAIIFAIVVCIAGVVLNKVNKDKSAKEINDIMNRLEKEDDGKSEDETK